MRRVSKEDVTDYQGFDDDGCEGKLSKFCYSIVNCDWGDDALAWTWSDMVMEVGAKETVDRINNMVSNVALVAALVITLTVPALMAIPVPIEGSTRYDEMYNQTTGEAVWAYEVAVIVYGTLFGLSTLSLAGSIILCVTVLVQLNAVRWDVPHLVAALKKNDCQTVISVWCFQFFNLGVILCLAGVMTSIWILYPILVFWVNVGWISFSFSISIWKGSQFAGAFMTTWKDGKLKALSTHKLKERKHSYEDYSAEGAFKNYDDDANGSLTWAEAKGKGMPMEVFKDIDADGNGVIDLAEYTTWWNAGSRSF